MIPNFDGYYSPEWAGDGKSFNHKGEKVIPIFPTIEDMDDFMIENNGLYDGFIEITDHQHFYDVVSDVNARVAIIRDGEIMII